MKRCPPRPPGRPGWRGLALLLLLSGCAATPALHGTQWQGQSHSFSPVDIDFEAATPRQAEQLRQHGVQLPRSSRGLADPRAHHGFVDARVQAVGFGITAGGYLLYCEGLALPVLVPESHVDLGLESAQPVGDDVIYPDRDAALAALPSRAGHARYAWYWGAGGQFVVPTVFSPATTPRIARTMLEVRRHLSETVQGELKALLLTLTGTKVLQGVFSRVLRVGTEPAVRPLPRGEGVGRGVSARPAPPVEAPPPTPVTTAPRPAAPAHPPAVPTPAPGTLAPSPGLVQALAGNNPTRQVAPGPRLPRDVAVKPSVPTQLPTQRPISSSPTQNAQLQADIDYLEKVGARNIRVNQQQLTQGDGRRVGIDRPDLQFDFGGRRYQVEYDIPTSGRGPAHQRRIQSNDPNADIILLIVP